MKMEEREENRHERLMQQFSELEKEWTAMKTGKSSSAVSRITVEEALEFVENSPRNLMLSLQHEAEAEMIQMRSPLRRKLFHDSDDDDDDNQTKKTKSFSHSSCWSSNVTRASDTTKSKKKTKMGRIVFVTMVLLLSWVLVVLMNNGFEHLSVNTHTNTLVPT